MAGSGWNDTRPMSPHLQVWRWHPTMLASTLHRLTGIALFGGLILTTAWIGALALGPQAFGVVEAVTGSPLGLVVKILFTFAVLFHLVNGVRFLLWDGPGVGFEPKVASQVSILNIVIAIAGTAALWAAILLA